MWKFTFKMNKESIDVYFSWGIQPTKEQLINTLKQEYKKSTILDDWQALFCINVLESISDLPRLRENEVVCTVENRILDIAIKFVRIQSLNIK